MKDDTPKPQINVSHILIGGGIAGAIFTIGSMLIFLVGIPLLRYLFPAALLMGGGVALLLRFTRHKTPGRSWLLPGAENPAQSYVKPKRNENSGRSIRILIDTYDSAQTV